MSIDPSNNPGELNKKPENPNGLLVTGQKEEVGQAQNQQEAAEAIFRDMLSHMQLFMGNAQSNGTWNIVELMKDGKKVPTAILALSQNNSVSAYFFEPEELELFAQSAVGTLQMVKGMMAKSGSLIVASQGQMEAALAQKKQMDGKVSPQHGGNWPPESWRN